MSRHRVAGLGRPSEASLASYFGPSQLHRGIRSSGQLTKTNRFAQGWQGLSTVGGPVSLAA
jgi:hypothetical protein